MEKSEDKNDMEELRKKWDPFLLKPVIDEEEKPTKFLHFLNYLVSTVVGLLVFVFGFFSKASLLLMITVTGSNSSTVLNKPFCRLILGCMLVVPNVLTFMKSLWKAIFKTSEMPSRPAIAFVCLVDVLVAGGTAVLIVITMPHFDILNNTMILSGVCILPAAFQVAHQCLPFGFKLWTFIASLLSVFLVLVGYIFFFIHSINSPSPGIMVYTGIAIACTLLVSLNWWENFTAMLPSKHLKSIHGSLQKSRNMTYLLSSCVRIVVTGAVVGGYTYATEDGRFFTVPYRLDITISLFIIQVASSAFCRWFSVIASKMHFFRRCFAFPMVLMSPAVLAFFIMIFSDRYNHFQQDIGCPNCSLSLYCQQSSSYIGHGVKQAGELFRDISNNLCSKTGMADQQQVPLVLIGVSSLSFWAGLVLSTVYVWFTKLQRIERTSKLFVRRLYEAAFIDQSMLLNVRLCQTQSEETSSTSESREHVTIYLCATMWHETFDEMLKILTSLFRIFMEEESSIFSQDYKMPRQKMVRTPYGGRLCYSLPKGNDLYVHFKDTSKIRQKKRWSQIMYMYYLLGWKLTKKYFDNIENGDLKTLEERLLVSVSLPRTLSCHLPATTPLHLPCVFQQKEKHNTYVLALDGDTDFQPSALMLLVDRLRMYPQVGAACGRIHPTGIGPMVWYQKFEYAVGHWLQKTAEHVFGCVLCSPGCFSLFRGSALMDDNVIKRYTTKATEAAHYVQYDQGEDRWLCTLLLQQGWRVEYNAASDAYTNSPQEFKEFYNQRRRWGPSTLANTLDILNMGRQIARRNPSISRPYIVYQIILMASSILSPASICLMIAGAFRYVFEVEPNGSLCLAVLPAVLYIVVCYTTKAEIQIMVAAVLSVLYTFLMLATIISIVGDIISEQTFFTPTGIFLFSMTMMYTVTAMLHPQEFYILIYGLLYLITVPSAYLLLNIYAMVNMNNVSWGTREKQTPDISKPSSTSSKRDQDTNMWGFSCCSFGFHVSRNSKVSDTSETQQLIEVKSAEPAEDLMEMTDDEECWMHQLQDCSDQVEFDEVFLDQDETLFWKGLIKQYLLPVMEDEKTKQDIMKDLRSLRNKANLAYFLINSLWIVAMFFLQIVGNAVSIQIPKVYFNGSLAADTIPVDPVGLVLLLSFAGLLVTQFIAMVYHRLYTFIHLIAFIGTESSGPKEEHKLSKINFYDPDKLDF
ncbi:chitin synthase chs-2-like isoform X3 [Polypterus senegalus]|uniref:chitin synthase chs-2-like isoform X3 n=1 Tax=Polypterus senegalus TaxID=55291 RepID=UPI001963759E|nr:chitin synthase chs-2-like isoform X3 [Polypterus senegalus]